MIPTPEAPVLHHSFLALEGGHPGTEAVAVLDRQLRFALVNPAFAALCGAPAEALVGQLITGLPVHRPAWLADLAGACAQAARGARAHAELLLPASGGAQRGQVWPLRGASGDVAGVAVRLEGAPPGAPGPLALSRALNRALTLEDVRQVLLSHAVPAMGAYAGTVIEVIDENSLFMMGSVGYGTPVEERWTHFPANPGFPVVRAVQSGAPLFATLDDLRRDFPAFAPYMRPGTRALAALPLRAGGEVRAVLTLSFRQEAGISPDRRPWLLTLADSCADALERAQRHDAERHARERATLLADVSSALAASLDPRETLERITALAIHHVADWAAVYLPTPEGTLTAAAAAHQDPELAQVLQQVVTRNLTGSTVPGTPAWVMQTGEAFMLPVVPADLTDQHPDAEQRAALRRVGFHSLIHVPLTVQGRVVGVLGLASAHPQRTYGPDDLALAEQLAARAALALDNALLYEASHLNEQRYRSLIDATRQTVWTNTAEGLLLGEQPGWARLTGQDQAAYSGTGWVDVIHPDDREHSLQRWLASVAVCAAYDTVQRVRTVDGSYRHFQVRAVPVLRPDGTVREWVGVHTDITERVRAEEELERRVEERTQALARSNAELERFAYVASHDLQEPLRTIGGLTGLLERRYGELYDERGRALLRMVIEGSERMKTLLDDLLVYSRLGAERLTLEPVDTNPLVQEAQERLSGALEDTGGQVTSGRLPTVAGSPFQLGQLFQNLIGNALKFHAPGVAPRVHLQATEEEGAWHFTVQDNGIGMEAGHLERIFVMFQRLHTREEYAGTGLGLAICQKVVERHGGRIWVESRPGEGSTFHFTLPAAPAGGQRVLAGRDPRA
ncbi:GAF domain-containing protein (plasmid) [Deinococcus taeanensis]|uniref:ATP-binding protein n=1 Tax=Deinococcus taeanensis TaxID=2737050 RepID=UPI001CDC0DB3|nr:ATP-binding protein [Deinococcus taeanensis]UBV44277.1 GAF domain-containing protein [Deinococcus taeanensis]